MGKLTKNRKLSEAKVDNSKLYNLDEACSLLKDITTTKFDASVDLAVRLGVDPKNIKGYNEAESLQNKLAVSPNKLLDLFKGFSWL